MRRNVSFGDVRVRFHERDILFRAGLSDMVVPYGDRDPMHNWKHVLDASEFCIGPSY